MGVDPNQNAYASSAATKAASSAPSSSSASASASTTRGCKRKHQNKDVDVVVPNEIGNQYAYGRSLAQDEDEPRARKAKKIKPAAPVGEKRLRRFRPQPPAAFEAICERATTQRFFVLSRTLCGTDECPEMFLEVSGSTGNVYNVCIARQPTCDCPHARAGHQCKHTIFVMTKVLRAKHEYTYQLALLSDELRDIFANCPNPAGDRAAGGDNDKNRKAVDGDCPICFEEMESGPGKEALVWCKAACGQNIHRQCFDMWAATKRETHGPKGITCPYCRSTWEGADDSGVVLANIRRGAPNSEGYVNVADQLGISTRRDYSTYSTWWSGNPLYRRRR